MIVVPETWTVKLVKAQIIREFADMLDNIWPAFKKLDEQPIL